MEANTTTHKFERAGLGKAPFRVVGNTQELFQAAPGAPVRAGTSCDYCGTAIADTYHIESADGKRFKVGNECVRKTGDGGLVRQAKAAGAPARRAKAKASKAREVERVRELERRLVEDQDLRALLAALPHPKEWAAEKGQTMLNSVEWMMDRAGHAGRMRMVRMVAKLEKGS
jgi:ribosome-binding protein aMBF1 (putative translation factor)